MYHVPFQSSAAAAACAALLCTALLTGTALLSGIALADAASLNVGPYNDSFLEGGIGVTRTLPAVTSAVADDGAWSLSGWIAPVRVQSGAVIVAAMGDSHGGPGAAGWHGLYFADGEICASLAVGTTLCGGQRLRPGQWRFAAVTFDGKVGRLYVDGTPVALTPATPAEVVPRIELAPAAARTPSTASPHFGGSVAELTFEPGAMSAAQVLARSLNRPDFALITFLRVGSGWPWQEHAWRGLQTPQDPWTLPHANTPPDTPVATPPPARTGLTPAPDGASTIGDWHLIAAPSITADGAQLSQAGYAEHDWYAAVVPGTVLTTLIARGIYPDPDFGLNNLAIPDSLSRQDYWYRTVFAAPAWNDRDVTLTFKGINYAAEIWMNGERVGKIRGAFTRGSFDVTRLIHPRADNALAVRISPPPHPGIPHEQSVAAGPGNNGGAMAIDGPTFIATEGWDWIPGIRDRNTGLWQDVEIKPTGGLHLRDPHIITHLPLPRTDTADISIIVPVENQRPAPVEATVTASFDDVRVEKSARLNPGVTEVRFDPAEIAALHVVSPKLWWPNGYGPATLHTMHIEVRDAKTVSDRATVRFGIRELTYELSLFDHDGGLRRVEVDPTEGSMQGERLIDVRHEAIKRTPQGWAESLTPEGEISSAVHAVAGEALSPYLVLRVNGVRIAARGGSWGMDDSRKRISRQRLEPYFRLHRDAHLNIIRNWLGQDTEDVFYDLADEYGLLVLNDFWESTQDFQVEAEDPALFLANARDVISRYRNHPSIAVWFGRNEGVPQPILNEGLADLVARLDGTRYYTGSSNSVNLQGSGPYNYRSPEDYFTELARGFSVEVGTPSLATLEALKASIPPADRWPLNDTYAYHDWHFGGNGDVATFMAAMAEEYGPGTSLEDFERKAQLMNYVSYRAIFEGFQAHLWTQNSGRLLWMTHPSWPSNTWQIYSSDYDTGAAYYAVKKACEPLHAQLNLPDFALDVVNTTQTAKLGLTLRSRVFSLDDRLLAERVEGVDAPANATTVLAPLAELVRALPRERLVLVRLTLTDEHGVLVSSNDYWQGLTPADQQRLTALAPQSLTLTARGVDAPDARLVRVTLRNHGHAPALAAKITVLDRDGARVLPIYYDDNYLTLLPGEERTVDIRCPSGPACARVALRGWNVVPRQTLIAN